MAIFYANSAGTQGTGDGSTEANACTLKQFMEDDAVLYQALAAGDTCYCKNGTEIIYDGSAGNYITLAISGTTLSPIRVIGYNTTIGDGGKIKIRDSYTGLSGNPFSWPVSYWHLYNFTFTDIRSIDVGGTNGHLFFNIDTNNALRRDFFINGGTGDCITLIGCVSNNSRAEGFLCTHRAMRLINCHSYNSSTNGFTVGQSAYGSFIHGCIAHNANGNGFHLTGEAELVNCISDGNNGDGFYLDDDRFTTLTNCGATNNGGYGINGVSGSNAFLLNFGDYNNTSGKINTTNVTKLLDENPQSGDPKYTDRANDIFTIKGDSPWANGGYGYNG